MVDRDPKVPLSEREGIAPFDGKRNFLHWLSTASRADLVAQRFVNGDGASVSAPESLLYMVLRHALLSALESGTLDAAGTFGAALFEVIDRDPLIANIGSSQNALRKDVLEVDASRLGLAPVPTALVDWTLARARLGGVQLPSTARVADVHSAISALADVPPRASSGSSPSMSISARTDSTRGSRRSTRSACLRCRARPSSRRSTSAAMDGSRIYDRRPDAYASRSTRSAGVARVRQRCVVRRFGERWLRPRPR